MTETPFPFDIQPTVSNHFAWLRTLLGLQRTLMAAVRTSVSLIGFGFTVAQFFQRLRGQVPDGFEVMNPAMPRNVGLVLIAAGVISLILFTIQYHYTVKALSTGPYAALVGPEKIRVQPLLVSYAVIIIGTFAFGSIFIHF
ncbi:MAG: DUF202 domain-containing protein [Porphyrobacter sp.]|nr:DUF202 domain-containing protein [Porphyrobacter sp.]